MSNDRMLSGGAFDPNAVKAMATAYEQALSSLKLVDRADPITEIIAKMIIEPAKRGELDALRLCDAVLDELRRKD